MILKILGCGTSTGVPIPGCQCKVCTSGKSTNNRSRTSAILIKEDGKGILIDASTDLRYQSLKWNIKRVDAVLYTHSHADHILGTDDLRCFNFVNQNVIPCYGSKSTLDRIKSFFDYIFSPDPNYEGGLLAQLSLHEIDEVSPFSLLDIQIKPFKLHHGSTQVTGFRFGDLAYATDCKVIPAESKEIIKGVKNLVLDGLRFKNHKTHLTIDEAIVLAEEIGAEKTYLTHMTHDLDYDELLLKLPKHIEPAYDGLEIPVQV
ncbi:MAG: MBL fold metallo-hydrolase [bacterium]|nr:MBL fold metallo-hydrolase [bacterium]